jgi:hypothetical protein
VAKKSGTSRNVIQGCGVDKNADSLVETCLALCHTIGFNLKWISSVRLGKSGRLTRCDDLVRSKRVQYPTMSAEQNSLKAQGSFSLAPQSTPCTGVQKSSQKDRPALHRCHHLTGLGVEDEALNSAEMQSYGSLYVLQGRRSTGKIKFLKLLPYVGRCMGRKNGRALEADAKGDDGEDLAQAHQGKW